MQIPSETQLFHGISSAETDEILQCLDAHAKRYGKGERILRIGEITENMGLVLSGSVNVEHCDVWGNHSILAHVEVGQLFAETYACIPNEPLMIDVVAVEKTEVLFLNANRLLTTCPHTCAHHNAVIRNLLLISAQKNLSLSRRILHTTSKSIRSRLLSYLSEQARKQGSYSFRIPFDRQQLADYLAVDRSALSNELSKMRHEGLLECTRNSFVLKEEKE